MRSRFGTALLGLIVAQSLTGVLAAGAAANRGRAGRPRPRAPAGGGAARVARADQAAARSAAAHARRAELAPPELLHPGLRPIAPDRPDAGVRCAQRACSIRGANPRRVARRHVAARVPAGGGQAQQHHRLDVQEPQRAYGSGTLSGFGQPEKRGVARIRDPRTPPTWPTSGCRRTFARGFVSCRRRPVGTRSASVARPG